ncbi:hypothetical protein D7Y13_07820 [Corallococcus praedator]|uniref:Integrase catalytic domain-containing protein n=1 Tax=Corallococcus praedator TaxID=2316724 RepID=A0ABX9QMG5_9BACT|nr:hypothetical protein D7X75_03440 [Corallococcus sp. CA031C]RKI13343.1 hypothetical protein D7Y13_07820 [Corallococcus praedator]
MGCASFAVVSRRAASHRDGSQFGASCRRALHPIEWLTDNGPACTARETREFGARLGLLIRTPPTYSPESNGTAEPFVKSFKCDYVYQARLDSAEVVLEQMPHWFNDYNTVHHRASAQRAKDELSA